MTKEFEAFIKMLKDSYSPSDTTIKKMVTAAEKAKESLAPHTESVEYDFCDMFLAERWHSSFAWNWQDRALSHFRKIAYKNWRQTLVEVE